MPRSRRPGDYRWKVIVQAVTETPRGSGDTSQAWETSFERYGSIDPLNGREMQNAKAIEADVTHRITMPADSLSVGINPKQRIKIMDPIRGDRYFNVFSCTCTEERFREVIVMCKEKV